MAAQILTDTTDTTLTSTDLIGDLTNLYSKKAWSTTGTGYATGDGAGGTVTQATSKATGVTLNKLCGQVTMNAAALASNTVVQFQLTNSTIAAADYVQVWLVSGAASGGSYNVWATTGNTSGAAFVQVRNITGGSLSEAIVLGFAVFKSATT